MKKNLRGKILELKKHNVIPTLAAILVGDNPASKIYVNRKHKVFINNNCNSIVYQLEKNISELDLIEFIEKLNFDKSIHGILVQLPLPKHLVLQLPETVDLSFAINPH